MQSGRDLSEAVGDLLCFTFPLLLKSDGTKFGKSESGAVWMSPDKLSPFGFFQFFRGLDDELAVKLLKMLTFLPMGDIHELVASMSREGYQPNTVQRILAEQVTLLVHGEQALQQALAVTTALFGEGPEDSELTLEVLKSIAQDRLLGDQHLRIPLATLEGREMLDVLVESKLFIAFGRPAKANHIETLSRQPKSGVRWNGKPISDVKRVLQLERDFLGGRFALLGSGQRRKALIEVVDT